MANIKSSTLTDSMGVTGLFISLINTGFFNCNEVVITNCYGYYIKDYE